MSKILKIKARQVGVNNVIVAKENPRNKINKFLLKFLNVEKLFLIPALRMFFLGSLRISNNSIFSRSPPHYYKL